MKNFLYSLLLTLPLLWYFSSCSRSTIEPSQSITEADSLHIDFETAKKISVNYYIDHQGKDQFVGASNARQEGIKGEKIIDSSFTIKDKKGRNFMHFFRFKENKGWNLISGDKRLFPILAYGNEGFAKLDTSKNPGLKFWMDDMLLLVESLDKGIEKPRKGIAKDWDKFLRGNLKNGRPSALPWDPQGCPESSQIWANLNNNSIGFTGLEWNQTKGFNHYMPLDLCDPNTDWYCNKYPVGCGPVAIGMIMHYYQRPISYSFNGNPRTANYGIMPFEIGFWDVTDCGNVSSQQEEVAALLRFSSGKHASPWCFTVSAPFYYSSKSVTALYPWLINNTFIDAGYANGGNKIDYSGGIAALKNNLKQRKPVIFSGSNCDVCLWNAHIWICEGLTEYQAPSCDVYNNLYMNWGWGGTDNGWYGISSGYSLNGTLYNSAHMKIVVDITP